jgi:LPXTG-site transpeptidase (sortase) family protein
MPEETPAVTYPSGGGYTADSVTAFTPAGELVRTDGSIGTLYVPSLSISMKVYEGTSAQSMSMGAGHFPDTSGWSGNIGLCGHNRNAKYTIGSIKDLKIGDTIKYTTLYGTRTYSVSFVGTISDTDWSRLGPAPDNRITLITCLADRPSLRVCVVAAEKE